MEDIMKMDIEKPGRKAAAVTAIIMLLVLLSGFADSRYASAQVVQELAQEIRDVKTNALEAQILQIEFQITQLQVKTVLTDAERIMLQTLQNVRERLLRQLNDSRS